MAVDTSGAAEKAGVKVHVVKAGEFKGAGTPGTAILDSHLMEMQRQVSGLNEFFIEAVSTGRGLEGTALEQVTDGRAHLAADAMRYGLIDEIADFEEYFESFHATVQQSAFYSSSPHRAVAMNDLIMFNLPVAEKQRLIDAGTEYAQAIEYAKNNQTASSSDLAKISNYNDEFARDCLSRGLTITEAKQEWEKRNAKPTYAKKYVP
jgi:ClpP class serine protease